MAKCNTIYDAAREWVSEFNAIPTEVIRKLMDYSCDEIIELTPPCVFDNVYIVSGEHDGEEGTIKDVLYDEENDEYRYEICLFNRYGNDIRVTLEKDEFVVTYDDYLPMWGTMWTFDDICDKDWLESEDNVRKMAECGFRIYEQEDFGYVFGIDGAGYDFYEQHWIPLYKERGLHWHNEEKE